MNLALSALIILLLLLPAVFFRLGTSMVSGKFSEVRKNQDQFSAESIRYNFGRLLAKLNFTETIFFFSIIPLLLHLVSLFLLHALHAHVDYAMLLNIFAGKTDAIRAGENETFVRELLYFLVYCTVEILLAFFLGWLLTLMILKKPDKIIAFLVGENIWFKLFTGLMLSREKRMRVDATLVEVL